MQGRQRIPKTVILLGVASLLADVASEMIYPILPMFVTTTLGAGRAALGLIEGVADATASLLKVFSGLWSDRLPSRKPLVVSGYAIAAVAKPPIAFAGSWVAVLFLRAADRVGKGIRTAPRDALITDATPSEIRGAAFGLHRAMDHAGAAIGPLIAAALLALSISYGTVIMLAGIPAFAVLLVFFFVKEHKRSMPTRNATVLFGWTELGPSFKAFLLAVLVFALGNASDVFLLQRLNEVGVAAWLVAVLWSAHHVVKMSVSLVGGRLSDSVGPRTALLIGWGIYSIAYVGFGFSTSAGLLIAFFMLYGAFHGFAEPAERAFVSRVAPEHLRGSAFGYFHGAIGLVALPASVMFGLLWQAFGAAAAFGTAAALAFAAGMLLLRVPAGGTTAKAVS